MLNSHLVSPYPILVDPVTRAKIYIFTLLIVTARLCDRYKPGINTSIKCRYKSIHVLII